MTIPRLVRKDDICAYLGGVSGATYDNWHAKGIVPGAVPGTTRYDIRAHDQALDRISGLDKSATDAKLSPLEDWERSHAA